MMQAEQRCDACACDEVCEYTRQRERAVGVLPLSGNVRSRMR